jgi:hypothetical protein
MRHNVSHLYKITAEIMILCTYFNVCFQIMFNDDLPATFHALSIQAYKVKQPSTWWALGWVTVSEHKLPMVYCYNLWLLKGPFLALDKFLGPLSLLARKGH